MKQDLTQNILSIIGSNSNNEQALVQALKKLLYDLDEHLPIEASYSLESIVAQQLQNLIAPSFDHNLIKTGYRDFDKAFGGLSCGELAVIGGRPSMGKTQFLVNLVLKIASNTPVLYFSFDLSLSMLSSRFLAAKTGIANQKILQNKLDDQEKQILTTATNNLKSYPIFVNDKGYNSLSAIKEESKKQIEQNGVKVIVVDYLQLMRFHQYRYDRVLEIGYITRALKMMAKELDVCVIAASQLNRSVETRSKESKVPQLADLRESGAIEQDADKVMLLYRPSYYGIHNDEMGNPIDGETHLFMAKNRNGIVDTIKLIFDKNFATINDYDDTLNSFSFDQTRVSQMFKPF